MSNARRLTLGFGIIALGYCAALPFRQTPKQQDSMAATANQDELELGKDVPLQVPGQKSVSDFRVASPNPKLVAKSSDANPPKDDSARGMAPAMNHQVFKPPALPDNYQPLFQPRRPAPLPTEQQSGALNPLTKTTPRHHTIHDGDTLESLALRYLGSAARAQDIFAANQGTLTDPNVLPIGVKIVIPRSVPDKQPAGKVLGIHGKPAGSVHMQPLAPLPNSRLLTSQQTAY